MTAPVSLPVDRSLRFDTFVVGASNRLAVSAARAVAEAPGDTYNPLFIYGGSGLGKTHLVAAIAQRARERQPDRQVLFTSGEAIAEQLHQAIAVGEMHPLLAQYQHAGLLILDDVQFLTGQRETQSELLRLLNTLLRDGRQLVLTSDRQPADIPDVDERLLSRLSGGLVVDVGAPDFEMRLAILRNVASDRQLHFGDGVLDEVARLPFGNVRELKGALNKLSAYQQLDAHAIESADVRAILGERSRPSVPERVAAVIPAGADYEGFLADVLQEVETRVEPWRVTLGDALQTWRPRGYAVAVLERALALPTAPDVDGLLSAFTSAVGHLQALEAQAVTLDPLLRGHPAFYDVEAVEAAEQLLQQTIQRMAPLPAPNPAWTLSGFTASPANQLALAAVHALLDEPGRRFNPLLLHGVAGSGKSHLAHAIGNAMLSRWSGWRVACITSRAYIEELIGAMQDGSMDRWRARYRQADVFILEDVQQLVGKERTQDELFHLFNHLVSRGGQIILTSDRAPRELFGLADRLRSRFEGGLVAMLEPHDPLQILATPIIPTPVPVDDAVRDRETMIWPWPDVTARLIEEYR